MYFYLKLSVYSFIVCIKVDEIQNSTEKADVAIDFTTHGVPSEAVKLIVKVLNLPTVAASYGQEGDIRSWRDIEGKNAEKYLIQISPPADLLVQSVRSIVGKQDMTSAVLLFDEEQYGLFFIKKEVSKIFQVSLFPNRNVSQI